jgi:RNA polymerase sigma-70 factor, ECF subfamily
MAQTAETESEPARLARIAAGDRGAMRQLYLDYHRRLFRFLMRITRSAPVAEEVLNDTMLTVWRSAGAFRGESQVSTWILGVAYRRALKALAVGRRERAHLVSLTGGVPGDAGAEGRYGGSAANGAGLESHALAAAPDAAVVLTSALGDIADLAERVELRDWLDAGLESLSAEHRLTIKLAYFVGLSCEEIAAVAQCPVGTVKTRLHYARLRLQQHLMQEARPRADREPDAIG